MKAVVAPHRGPPEVLRVEERGAPGPGPRQYVVQVLAAGVNPVDWKLRRAGLGPYRPHFPWTPGCELYGVVLRAGPGATRFAVGTRVIALLDPRHGGAAAQMAVIDEEAAVEAPARLAPEEAAGLVVGGLTSIQALKHRARLRPGQRVLVNGASGGVGHLAVQIARAYGAHVTAVCGPTNVGWVRGLGAERVLDYHVLDFARENVLYDVIFDAVATTTFWRCRRVLARGGTYVTTLPGLANIAEVPLAWLAGRHLRFVRVRPDGQDLAELALLATDGSVRVVVGRVFALAETAAAHAAGETGHARGKLVVRPG